MYIMLDIINASAGSMARKAAEAQQAAEGGLSKKMKASCLTFLSSLALSCKAKENRSTKARLQHYANQPIKAFFLASGCITQLIDKLMK